MRVVALTCLAVVPLLPLAAEEPTQWAWSANHFEATLAQTAAEGT